MNIKGVLADFQFLGNRVSKLALETRNIEVKGKSNLSFDFDYKVLDVLDEQSRFLGILMFIVKVKAKIQNKLLFTISLEMEGHFAGNPANLPREKFIEMLELNGLVTLLHISRAYIASITAQSGINPPIMIPMINVLKLRAEKSKTSNL